MLDGFQNINLFPITGFDVFSNLVMALLCGTAIAWLYRFTYKGPGYSASFVGSLLLLCLITGVIMMVIGNSLARAFGLVGAMSIIRFRTAVKETQDIVFIFLSLTVGMAAGVGYHKIAFMATLFIGVVLLVLSKTNLTAPKQQEYLLQFSFSPNGHDLPSYQPVMNKYCRRHKVIDVKSQGSGDELELSYYVRFKDKERNDEFVRELKNTHGVRYINLYYDDEQF